MDKKNLIDLLENSTEISINLNLDTAETFKEIEKDLKKKFSSIVKVDTGSKVFFVADPYLNLEPDLKDFSKIVSNSVFAANKLGVEKVKAAVLSAVELVNLNMESSVFGAVAEAMGKRGQFGKNTFVEGPLSMDVAVSEEAAKEKKVFTDVSGKANVLIAHYPSIAKGIVEAMEFLGFKTEKFLTDGNKVFKIV